MCDGGRRRTVRRVTRLRPAPADIALALLIGFVSMQSAFDGGALKSPAWAVILLIQLTAIPLAWRRVWPVGVFGVTLAAAVAGHLAFDGLQVLGAMIALHAVARHRDLTTSAGAVSVALTASIIPVAAERQVTPLFAAAMAAGFGVAWLLGRRSGQREAELAAARAQTAAAVDLERARIARELHDVISHNVSVMVVQAAAARDVFAARPDRALTALEAIEATGREALGELRMLLSFDYADERAALLAPQPTLDRLPALIEQVRTTGVDVALDAGDLGPLPAAVDVSAYRIVQEALTNVVKHAAASAAGVSVRRTATRLELEITDDGRGPAGAGDGARGLTGMRERVHLLGGELATGPRAAGGFAVRAWLPLAEPRR